MLEAIIGAAVGAILGAVGTWIVSRSERLKAEEAAALASAEAAAQAANAVIAAELAQRLGSMCSPFTADTIEAEDVAKMRADWEAYAQSLRLRNFIGAISDLSDAVNSYIDALAEYTAGKEVRGRVEQRRERALTTAKVLMFPSKAA